MVETLSTPVISRAITVAIDDLGWLEGSSQKLSGGPSRLGVKRRMALSDYKPIVDVAKAVGIRLPGFFVLMDFDRENVCAKYPSTNPNGSAFDNRRYRTDLQQSIIDYIRSNAANLEFGFHGVGHEYWNQGNRIRAEWYNLENDHPWDELVLLDHLKCAREILAQYDLSPAHGHTFPEHFVPCAYGYHWNPEGNFSTGKLMGDAGVKYANTMFSEIASQNPPVREGGGFDHQLLVLDRHIYGIQWYELAAIPQIPNEGFTSDLIETHWVNWVAQDDFLQKDVTQCWIDFFRSIQQHPEYHLAKNSEQLYSQWLYRCYTTVKRHDSGKFIIDNSSMPDKAYEYSHLSNMVLSIPVQKNQHVSTALLNGKPIPAYYEDEGFAYIYLPKLKQQPYLFEYTLGSELPIGIIHSDTANIYDFTTDEVHIVLDLKLYGEQQLQIQLNKHPISIRSENPVITLSASSYSEETGQLHLSVNARNIQGERGNIIITLQ